MQRHAFSSKSPPSAFSNRVLDFYYANAEGGNFLTRIFKFFSFFYFRQRNTLGYVQNVVSVKSCTNSKNAYTYYFINAFEPQFLTSIFKKIEKLLSGFQRTSV